MAVTIEWLGERYTVDGLVWTGPDEQAVIVLQAATNLLPKTPDIPDLDYEAAKAALDIFTLGEIVDRDPVPENLVDGRPPVY